MSENKYIIDKDSLTGIADAVRNKLGTGEATTDETTGEIVYPEDKGYYLKQGKLAGFIYPATSLSSYTEIMSVSHETILELCGNINPSFIKFTVLTKGESNSSYSTPSQTLYNGVYFYSGEITNSTTLLNNVVGATKTFAYTGQGCYITGALGSYSAGGWNPNYYSFYSFPGSLRIEFLNENQQNIEAAVDGPIEGRTSGYTMEIPNGEVPTKIPFSIDDIQNKITDYLGKKEAGVGIAIFTPNSFPNITFGNLSKYNKISTSGYYCLNFNDNTYLSNTIPTIRPENILYLEYAGNQYTYIFNVNTASIEHYTSATINYGKRLSSATDYYYYKDTDGAYKTSNGGILGMWDDVNKQLDLGFQSKQSASGNSISTNYCTWYGNSCYYMIIVYKEATE